MQMDQAGCHMSEKLVVLNNISIIALPATYPELNPVENNWHSCATTGSPTDS